LCSKNSFVYLNEGQSSCQFGSKKTIEKAKKIVEHFGKL
jgi:hypothetical protein